VTTQTFKDANLKQTILSQVESR